ncbi:hypothetical protein B7494_g716 [Chlorociboria aeruginascens]|nr:hypothetical protein B7494_g716 [Chlorociboria aeruginascens]
MRFLKAAVLALTGLALAFSIESEAEAYQSLDKRAANPSVSGLKFNIDGVVDYFAGTNAYWIGFLTNNADVDLVMSHLQTAGLKVLRVWGFNDITSATSSVWFQSFITGASPVINTGTNGLQRLDYVVTSAEAHGIKLIINFVNNWSDYGGMAAYNTYYGTNATTWYTDSRVQTQYQTYIRAVISRYQNSSAIFAWELANEPRCHGCATSVITNWATTTSAYIKSLDSTHMITMGDEGFMNGGGDGSYPYTTGEGLDWAVNLQIPDISFGTLHLYPDQWGETNNWGNSWITVHGAVCATVGKPCILEEYGSSSDHVTVEAPWQATALATSGIAGDMFWQDGDTLSTGQTSNDGNTIYYGSSDWTSLVTDHVAAIDGGSSCL